MPSQLKMLAGRPCDKYYCLFKAYFHNKQTDSKGLEEILKFFFDTKLSDKQKIKLLSEYRANKGFKKKV